MSKAIENNLKMAKYSNKRLQFDKLPVKQFKNNVALKLKCLKFDMTAKTVKYGYNDMTRISPRGLIRGGAYLLQENFTWGLIRGWGLNRGITVLEMKRYNR